MYDVGRKAVIEREHRLRDTPYFRGTGKTRRKHWIGNGAGKCRNANSSRKPLVSRFPAQAGTFSSRAQVLRESRVRIRVVKVQGRGLYKTALRHGLKPGRKFENLSLSVSWSRPRPLHPRTRL